ncbi:MAG: hypothetical protein H6679_04585 [Epsilonproteobacteria bacterium]|nr:hypothetical protein [Campylobacterota bacterium]
MNKTTYLLLALASCFFIKCDGRKHNAGDINTKTQEERLLTHLKIRDRAFNDVALKEAAGLAGKSDDAKKATYATIAGLLNVIEFVEDPSDPDDEIKVVKDINDPATLTAAKNDIKDMQTLVAWAQKGNSPEQQALKNLLGIK